MNHNLNSFDESNVKKRTCARKFPYKTKGEAEQVIQQRQRVKRKNVRDSFAGSMGLMMPYKCKFCGHWHIGHSNPKHYLNYLKQSTNKK